MLSIKEREYKGVELLTTKGYTEYAFTGINSIFVLEEAVDEFNIRRKMQLAEKSVE